MLAIYADGEVTICPEDWDQMMIIGDVTNESIYDIWHREKLYYIKTCQIDGDWEQLPACRSCEAHYLKNLGNWFGENKEIALKRHKHKE